MKIDNVRKQASRIRTGKGLEDFVYRLFKEVGYDAKRRVILRGLRSKGEVDILLTRPLFPLLPAMIIIETKWWNKKVNVDAVRRIHHYLNDFGAERAIVISKAGFQKGAKEFKDRRIIRVTLDKFLDYYSIEILKKVIDKNNQISPFLIKEQSLTFKLYGPLNNNVIVTKSCFLKSNQKGLSGRWEYISYQTGKVISIDVLGGRIRRKSSASEGIRTKGLFWLDFGKKLKLRGSHRYIITYKTQGFFTDPANILTFTINYPMESARFALRFSKRRLPKKIGLIRLRGVNSKNEITIQRYKKYKTAKEVVYFFERKNLLPFQVFQFEWRH